MISLTELLNAEAAFTWAMESDPKAIEKEETEMLSCNEKAQLEWFKRNVRLTEKLDRIATALEKLSTIFGSDIDKIAELIKDADSKEQYNVCQSSEEEGKEDD